MKTAVFLAAVLWVEVGLAGTKYIDQIPDFTQTDVIGKTHGNGQQYCGPVAVSNSLIWLSSSDRNRQLKLIKQLASKQYMNTSLKNGTGTTGVLRGVEKISKDLFGGYKELSYQGWRKHPAHYSEGVKVPDIEKVKSFISKNSTAWLNVGWYKYDQRSNEYQRIGGHWVTLVGTRHNQLVLHDPSPRAGKRFSNEYVDYSFIRSGKLTGRKKGLPASADGYISLESGMHKKSGADFAIVDGIVYFSI